MRNQSESALRDEELRSEVTREIGCRPSIHSQAINVTASGAAITLTGFVHTFAQKRIAERAAKSVCGVVSVTNDIEVQRGTRTDPEIAREVQHVLKSHAIVSECKINATVHQGVVTLDGTVQSNYQKVSAADAVMGVHGVLSVVDLIMVKPRALPPIVKGAIEAALKENADLDAKNIHVAINNGTVELTGKVHSILEREEAERAAWDAPGVVSVENRLWVTC